MSLKNIPTNWCVSTIGDINDYKSFTFNPKSHQESEFELYSVPSFASGSPEVLLGKDIASNKQYIQFKDILLSKINPRINRVWCVKEKRDLPQIGSSEWIVIRQPLIHEGFLTYFLQTQSFRDLLCSDVSGVGGSLTRAQPRRVATYHVPIAPFQEQKIIAEKLDTLLAQVDSTKARLEQIPKILKRFRQTVLAAAVSGKLTESWRNEQGTNFSKWENTFFENICTEITVGYVGKMLDRYQSEGIPFLRSQNVREFKFSDKNLLYITESFHKEIFKSRLTPGDLAIVRSGAPGTTCVIPNSLPVANCSDLVIARPSEKLNSSFGCIFMNSNVAKINVSENRVGIAQQHFNVGSMKKMPIHLPPISEQTEIVRRVEQLFAYADTIEKQVNNALARVNNLTQSILAKAFRGEMTAQWRAENPDLISGENSAAALLEKIKAERAASGSKKASRKKT